MLGVSVHCGGEGQVCQSVQGRLYLWAQQWAGQCGFLKLQYMMGCAGTGAERNLVAKGVMRTQRWSVLVRVAPRQSLVEPLFRHVNDGKLVTSRHVVDAIKQQAVCMGLDPKHYAGDGVCVGTECQSVQKRRYFWAQRVLCISVL